MLPVLIVDDVREDALLAQRVIAQCRIQNPVHAFSKGEECVNYFRGLPPHQGRVLPCLVLLDMVMAPMSGLEVLKQLKRLPEAVGSVLVMLSGMMDLKAIHAGYQLGAQTFLVKPLFVEDMMQMLRAIRTLRIDSVPKGFVLSLATQATVPGLPPLMEESSPMSQRPPGLQEGS